MGNSILPLECLRPICAALSMHLPPSVIALFLRAGISFIRKGIPNESKPFIIFDFDKPLRLYSAKISNIA